MTVTDRDAARSPEATSRTSPYQGLVPYGEHDKEWFFGRDTACDVVVDTLRAYRVSVLYGESGVGKSSLLRAAVLARLRDESHRLDAEGQPDLLAVAFANWSGDEPLVALKAAVVAAASEFSDHLEDIAPDASLATLLAAVADRLGSEVLIILDQVEELFQYHADDQSGLAFQAELAEALRRRGVPAKVILAIREDALAKLDGLQRLVPGLLDNLVRLGHLDESAARQA